MSLKNTKRAVVTGNTYAVRDKIKRLGGRWDAEGQCWVIDVANHPRNTMKARAGLACDLRALTTEGCTVHYE